MTRQRTGPHRVWTAALTRTSGGWGSQSNNATVYTACQHLISFADCCSDVDPTRYILILFHAVECAFVPSLASNKRGGKYKRQNRASNGVCGLNIVDPFTFLNSSWHGGPTSWTVQTLCASKSGKDNACSKQMYLACLPMIEGREGTFRPVP